VKNFTIRQFNHSQHTDKWYIKVPIIASKYEEEIFATEPKLWFRCKKSGLVAK